MNGKTLQALRGFLFFTVPEAARMIGAVQERSWRRWEYDGAPVPADVQETILQLIEARSLMLSNAKVEIAKAGESDVLLTYYENIDDWLEAPIMWRVHCSAMAKLASLGKNIKLVAFDSVNYKNWLGEKEDNQGNRAAWAASSA